MYHWTVRTRARATTARRATRRFVTAALVAALAVAITATAPAGTMSDRMSAVVGDGVRLDRTLLDPRITESSGLTLSTRFSGIDLTHNDSGDGARVFAVGRSGQTQAVWTIGGATSRDWEDIASGPDHTVWVGDIGDNSTRHDSIYVYAFVEPTELRSRTLQARKYEFVYPRGRSHNAEALLVRPRNGRVLIVTKDRQGGAFYRAPRTLSTSRVNVLRRVASAPAVVTGGAVTPRSRQLVLRTHGSAFVYDSAMSRPSVVPLPHSGESLAVSGDGDALLIGSEGTRSDVFSVPFG